MKLMLDDLDTDRGLQNENMNEECRAGKCTDEKIVHLKDSGEDVVAGNVPYTPPDICWIQPTQGKTSEVLWIESSSKTNTKTVL